jgi:hypothetical protein
VPITSRDFAGPEKLVSCLVYIDQLQIVDIKRNIEKSSRRHFARFVHVRNWNFLFYCSNIAKSENAMLWRMLSRLETCIVYSCKNRKLSSRIYLQNQLFCLCRLPAVILLDLKNLSRVLYILINCKLLISRGILYYI